MKKFSISLIMMICLVSLSAMAQRSKKVCGEYTYYAEGNVSLNEAKIIALENAKLQALAREFGTVVTQSTTQDESYSDGQEHTYFAQLSSSEVRGEWLENDGEPVYNIDFANDMLIVKCSVCGIARELSNEVADFETMVLRNGTSTKFADTHFKAGDDMYLYFKAPSDGYVAVYLIDETPEAFCLLPYASDVDGLYPVVHGQEYIFFSMEKEQKDKYMVDEYTLTCSKDVERNRMYVIFSENPFTKAVDSQVQDGLPRQLSYNDFSNWLARRRSRDEKMGVKVMYIDVKP